MIYSAPDLTDYRIDNKDFFNTAKIVQGEGLTYLAGPYTGMTRNHQKINVAVMKAYHWALTAGGLTPIAMPILNSQYDYLPVTELFSHKDWITQCKNVISNCSLLLLMPHSCNSSGCKIEVEFAKEKGIMMMEVPEINIITIEQIMRAMEIMQ